MRNAIIAFVIAIAMAACSATTPLDPAPEPQYGIGCPGYFTPAEPGEDGNPTVIECDEALFAE